MAELVWEGKRDGRLVEPSALARPLRTIERVGEWPPARPRAGDAGPAWRNRLILGDRRQALPALLPDLAGRVDLAYLDPPFFTGSDFAQSVGLAGPTTSGPRPAIRRPAFSDTWERGLDGYLQWFYETIVLLRELLAEDGSLYVHLDWHAGHYARCILDEVFGARSFRNDLIWAYGGRGRGAKAIAGQFPRNHDVIFWYAKSASPKYHPQRLEKRLSPAEARRAGFRVDAEGRWFKTAPRGDYTDRSIARLEARGRVHRTSSGSVRVKYFLRQEGEHVVEDGLIGDVWADIPDAMHLPTAERTGYATQKPEALLDRIVRASSDAGDLVLDCCCGSGTTAVVAERLGRRWVAGDVSPLAVHTARKRLLAIPDLRPLVVQTLDDASRPLTGGLWPEGEENGPRPTLAVSLRQAGRRVEVALTDYRPADPKLRPSDSASGWERWIDYWAIDWDFRGEVFHNCWRDYQTLRRPEVATAAAHAYDRPGAYRVAVRVVDVLGAEVAATLEVLVP